MNIDQLLFKFINQDLTNPVFDFFFPLWTDIQKHPIFFFLIIPALLFFILKKRDWRLLRVVLLCTTATWATDNINHFFIKPMFNKERPKATILRVTEQKNSSFPSSHAADAFAVAVLLSLFYRNKKIIFLTLAGLSAFARIYCGVHFPSDVLAGAMFGTMMAFMFYQLARIKKLAPLFLLAIIASTSYAEDPTAGKPLLPWVWNDQLKPTIKKSVDSDGLKILGAGAATSLAVRPYDEAILEYNREHPILFGEEDAHYMAKVGNGSIGVGIAAAQLFFDQKNGLKHARAILLTTVSHMSLAYVVQRERPGNKTDFLPYPSSFPSGHTSSAFATAGSLAYAYGWKVGVPAYTLASAIGIARIRDERHWSSDIVAGAFLGAFWARASYNADSTDAESFTYVPVPVYDGVMISAMKSF